MGAYRTIKGGLRIRRFSDFKLGGRLTISQHNTAMPTVTNGATYFPSLLFFHHLQKQSPFKPKPPPPRKTSSALLHTMASTSGWIDIHGHFKPPRSESASQKAWQDLKDVRFMAPKPYEWNEHDILAYLDRAGISMQMLSYIPKNIDALKQSNDFGASVVGRHPSRFGLLAALPTNDPAACLQEIRRAQTELHADGFAVTCCYQGVYFSDPILEPVLKELNKIGAVVFLHPDGFAPPVQGRPVPISEVFFETTRTVVDMLYAGIFRDYTDIKFIVAHCGAAVPILADRLELLGTEPWVPNPHGIKKKEIKQHLSTLFLDTAGTGCAPLAAAIGLVGCDHIVYGADCGVPCSTEETLEENRKSILAYEGMTREERQAIGHNVRALFPQAVERMRSAP